MSRSSRLSGSLVEGALLILDDTDWTQVARAMRDDRASQPRARFLIEPWGWEGVQVLRWGYPTSSG
ncbi:MAG: hypothetical protein ACRELA_21020 [Candidatus Rokuibacteriota bacterium]